MRLPSVLRPRLARAVQHCDVSRGSSKVSRTRRPSSRSPAATRLQIADILAGMAELRKTVLVVDSDETSREALSGALRRDYRVLRTATGENAIHMAEREVVDVMLLDVTLPGINAIDVLKIVKENYPQIAVVVTSPVEELAVAIEAMRHGAFHYMAKNAGDEAVRTLVASACERLDQNRSFVRLSAELAAEQGDREFVVGASRVTREIVDLVQRIAKRPATVLVLGESGTGKELLARLI